MYNAGAVSVEYSGFGDMERRAIYYQGSGQKGHLFLGIWGEGQFIFRDLGRRKVIYFQEYGGKGNLLSGIWGEGSFISSEVWGERPFIGRRANYFQGSGEQAQTLGSRGKKVL